MKDFDEIKLHRITVNVEDECKKWYMAKAKSMGMSTNNLMGYVLADYYEKHKNAEAVRVLSELGTSNDLNESNKSLVELLTYFKGLDFKDS